MSSSVINEISKGIAEALYEAFGKGYAIYQNDVQQGLAEPCFFIALLKPDVKPLLGRRRLRHNPFDICYFPANPGDNLELQEAAEQMFAALEAIRLPNGDLLQGTNISWQTADEVLHFLVSYNLIQYEPPQKTAMEQLKAQVNTDNK